MTGAGYANRKIVGKHGKIIGTHRKNIGNHRTNIVFLVLFGMFLLIINALFCKRSRYLPPAPQKKMGGQIIIQEGGREVGGMQMRGWGIAILG